jgi:excisionase family DNA binding protein
VPNPEPRHLLSTTEASVRLGVSSTHVARLARAGRLPVYATSGRQRDRLFDPREIDRIAIERGALLAGAA